MPSNSTPNETDRKIACLKAILDIPSITEEATGWMPSGLERILRGCTDPIAAVEKLLPKGNPTGFAKLQEMRRLDLTVEVFVLDKRWSEWFSADLKQIAVKRLAEAGYDEPEPRYLWNRHAKKRRPSG
jgi:hypothetical protein